MPRHPKYASHDPRIKALISRTGRLDLFPNLKIPRTTALYWVEQGFEINDPLLDSLASTINEMREEQIGMKAVLLEAIVSQTNSGHFPMLLWAAAETMASFWLDVRSPC